MSRETHFFEMGLAHASKGKDDAPHDIITQICSEIFGEGILAGDNRNYRAGHSAYVSSDEGEDDEDDEDDEVDEEEE